MLLLPGTSSKGGHKAFYNGISFLQYTYKWHRHKTIDSVKKLGRKDHGLTSIPPPPLSLRLYMRIDYGRELPSKKIWCALILLKMVKRGEASGRMNQQTESRWSAITDRIEIYMKGWNNTCVLSLWGLVGMPDGSRGGWILTHGFGYGRGRLIKTSVGWQSPPNA